MDQLYIIANNINCENIIHVSPVFLSVTPQVATVYNIYDSASFPEAQLWESIMGKAVGKCFCDESYLWYLYSKSCCTLYNDDNVYSILFMGNTIQ